MTSSGLPLPATSGQLQHPPWTSREDCVLSKQPSYTATAYVHKIQRYPPETDNYALTVTVATCSAWETVGSGTFANLASSTALRSAQTSLIYQVSIFQIQTILLTLYP